MSDEMDLCDCECLWGHELSMRRLLSFLRQSQAYCTDTECVDISTPQSSGQDPNSLLLMTMIFAFAMFMYYVRPRPTQTIEPPSKPHGNGHDDSQGAPPPPPATS